jgi:hypothetical protein
LPLELEDGAPDLDDVPGAEPRGRVDAKAVHPRAVRRAEVLDLQRALGRSEQQVPARDERVVDSDVGGGAAEDEGRLDGHSPPGERPVFHQQNRHGNQPEGRSSD